MVSGRLTTGPGKLRIRGRIQTLAAAAIVKIVPENLVAEWASNRKKTISALNEA